MGVEVVDRQFDNYLDNRKSLCICTQLPFLLVVLLLLGHRPFPFLLVDLERRLRLSFLELEIQDLVFDFLDIFVGLVIELL